MATLMTYANLEQHASKLLSQHETLQSKLLLVRSLRIHIEIVQTTKYQSFLDTFFPVFEKLLAHTKTPQLEDVEEQKLRYEVLDILSRLPTNGVMVAYAARLCKLVIFCLSQENEKNGLICLQILNNLHQHLRPHIQRETQAFLIFIHKVYADFEDNARKATEGQQHEVEGTSASKSSKSLPACQSFKVITESVLFFMRLLSSPDSEGRRDMVSKIVPLIVKAVGFQYPVSASNLRTSNCPSSNSQQILTELKVGQAKALMTLMVLMKVYPEVVRPHGRDIANIIVKSLESCPSHVTEIRRDLFEIIRRFLTLDWGTTFPDFVYKLYDERFLLGSKQRGPEYLYLSVAEVLCALFNYASTRLDTPFVSQQLVNTSTRFINEYYLPSAYQLKLIRVILSMASNLQAKNNIGLPKEEAKAIMVQSMETLMIHFRAVKGYLPKVLSVDAKDAKNDAEKRSIGDLVYMLFVGLCTLVTINLVHVTPSSTSGDPNNGVSTSKVLTGDETHMVAKMLRRAVSYATLFEEQNFERMLLRATVAFRCMDHSSMMTIFSLCIDSVFQNSLTCRHKTYFHQFFLNSEVTRRPYMEVLLSYLVETKLDTLKHVSPTSNLVVSLFNLIYKAMAMANSESSVDITTHIDKVKRIIQACVDLAVEVANPRQCINLVMETFGAFQTPTFHKLWPHLTHLLTPCLDTFLHLLNDNNINNNPTTRDALIQLCIIFPAEPGTLLKHLRRLVRGPLLLALAPPADNEPLLKIGLEYLDGWIDHLGVPAFATSVGAETLSELSATLASHLRPPARSPSFESRLHEGGDGSGGDPPSPVYFWGEMMLTVLGKLGSEGRSFLSREPLEVEVTVDSREARAMLVDCAFKLDAPVHVPLDGSIKCSVQKLNMSGSVCSSSNIAYRKQAFKFLQLSLGAALNLTGEMDMAHKNLSASLMSSVPKKYCTSTFINESDVTTGTAIVKPEARRAAEHRVLKELLMAFIAMSLDKELQSDTTEEKFVVSVTRHFAILHGVRAMEIVMKSLKPPSGNNSAHIDEEATTRDLNLKVFMDAVVTVLASPNPLHAKGALYVLKMFLEMFWEILQSLQNVHKTFDHTENDDSNTTITPTFGSTNNNHHAESRDRLVHASYIVFDEVYSFLYKFCCHGTDRLSQLGGFRGFGIFFRSIPPSAMWKYQESVIRSLICFMKWWPAQNRVEEEEVDGLLGHLLNKVYTIIFHAGHPFPEIMLKSAQKIAELMLAALLESNTKTNSWKKPLGKPVQDSLVDLIAIIQTRVAAVGILNPWREVVWRSLASSNGNELEMQTKLRLLLKIRVPYLLEIIPKVWLHQHFQRALAIVQFEPISNEELQLQRNERKVVCIDLLCAALSRNDIRNHLPSKMKSEIMNMYLNNLTSNVPAYVQVAKSNLHQVIEPENYSLVTREMLKPLLMRLRSFKSLDLPLLQGLGLLSNNILTVSRSVANELMEHLKSFLAPNNLLEFQSSWKAGMDSNIASGIMQLCTLFNSPLESYLGEMVEVAMKLEAALPAGLHHTKFPRSPYHAPLARVLNQNPRTAVQYFLPRLNQPAVYHLFKNTMRTDHGKPIRTEFLMQTQTLSLEQVISFQYEFVALVALMMKLDHSEAVPNIFIMKLLIQLWKSHAQKTHLVVGGEGSTLRQAIQFKRLKHCLFKILRHRKGQWSLFWDMIPLFLVEKHPQQQDVQLFFENEVLQGSTPAEKKSFLDYTFLKHFKNYPVSNEQMFLTVALRRVITPMLVHAWKYNYIDEVLGRPVLLELRALLLEPRTEVMEMYTEELTAQVLQLATLLLAHTSVATRLVLLGNGNASGIRWPIPSLCKREIERMDCRPSRIWALLAAAESFELSPQVLQPDPDILKEAHNVLCQLLRAIINGTKESSLRVMHAITVLLPKLPQGRPSDEQPPYWVLLFRYFLISTENSDKLVRLLEIIKNQPDSFYAFRGQFVQQLVRTSIRFGNMNVKSSPPLRSGAVEYFHTLAVDVAGLVVAWEARSQQQPETHSFHFNKPTEEFSAEIANFLVKMAVLHKENTTTALHFLLKAVELWPNMNVQFKLLLTDTNCLPQQLWVMIQMIQKQPHRFIRSNILALTEVLELSFSQRSEGITLMLCMLVKSLFTPTSDVGTSIVAPELLDLQHKVSKLLSSNLQAVLRNLQAPMEMKNAMHIATHALQVLETLAEIRVDLIDSYMKQLWSLFGHVTNRVLGVVDPKKKNEQESDMTTLAPLYLKLLRVLGHHIPRRPGLVDGSLMYLKNLAKKTEHAVSLLGILDLLRDWWIDASDQDMWVQDSGAQRIANCMEILGHVDHLKMETKHQVKWEVGFLNLLFCVCSDDHSRYPQSFRTAIFLKLKKMCLRGLVVEDPEVRQKFRTLFSSVGSSTFSMLTFIIEFDGWEKLCGSFWLQQGLDLILGFAQDASARNASVDDTQMETQTAQESTTPLPDSPFPAELEECLEGFAYKDDTVPAAKFDEDPAFSLGDLGIQLSELAVQVPDETPQVTSDITDKHAMFLIGMSHIKVTEVLTSLREISKMDTAVAHQLWVTLFPLLWSNLQVEEMERLKDSIVTLLAKDWHYEQRHQRPNVVKTLLESISLCQPLPRLPSLLVTFLGKRYGACQIACSILGSSLPNDPEDQHHLAKLYSHVDAEDLRVGLWKQISTCSVTLNGLSMLQHGYYETALDFFLHAMQSSCEKRSGLEDLPIWSEKVMECARQLNQWEVLAAMGHNKENFFLLQDTSWIIRDFPKLKNLVNEEQMEDCDKKYIVLAYMAMMQDPETKSAEQFIKEARIHALQNWWETPKTGVHTCSSILHDSQRLLEISEIKEVYTQTKQLSLEEVPPALETTKVLQVVNSLADVLLKWQHRIPNKSDNMAVWGELMQWRHYVCADIVRMCNHENSSPALKQLSDLSSQHLVWTAHKVASAARKQGLHQLSRQTLDNLQNKCQLSRQLNVEESYLDVMEKAKTDLHIGGRLVNGYNLLMKTDVSPFSNSQKARFFQLQGEYITKLRQQQQHQEGDNKKLMDVILSSIHLEEGFAKSWISWGNFCNQVYTDTRDQSMLEGTLMCSFKGIKLKSKHKYDYLPRLLSLLTFHNQEGTVTRAFEKWSELIPPSSWIPWIPHLLLALQTSTLSNNTCAKILKELAISFPQSLYYWIYSVPSGLGQDAGASTTYEAHSPQINNLHINVIRNILMGKSQSLLRELQDFRVHVGYLFPTNTDEKLHEHLHSLLGYCYKGELKLSEKEVPCNLPYLKTLYDHVFKTAMVTQYADYARTYERDFYNPASTLADLIGRTKHWLRDLQIKLHNRPQVLMLEANEHFRRRSFKEIQIPGQYLKNPEVHPDQIVLLDRISTQIQTVTRNGRFLRRIVLIGHDGSHHHFLRQLGSIKSSHSSDRVVHLLRTLNQFLDNHKESRRRQLRIHTPVTVPLGMFENDAHVYLMEDRQADTLLEDVYKSECEKLDQDPELPLDLILKCLDVPSSEIGDHAIRLGNYNNIVENVVKDTLFSQHMCKILTTDGMWTFKKQFTAHLALSGFTSYMLKAKSPAPSNLVFAKNFGQIFLSDFHPDYDSSGALECKDPVSFRLTPNLQNFITRAGVDGPFLASMRASAQAIAHKDEHFLNHLLVFYADELLSHRISTSLQERVTENAEQTLTQILHISPQADLKEEFDPNEMHLPLHQEVTTLLEAATKPENLCKMDPTWHPWF